MTPDKWWDMEDRDPPVSSGGNPYISGGGMKLNTGKMTMQYAMHRAWDEGYAAAERQRTVAEIVAELRGIASDFGNGEVDHPAVAEAADLIEQRFSVKKEEDDGNRVAE